MEYNKRAFRSHNSSNDLLVAYCTLVECELDLKVLLAGHTSKRDGHNVPRMLHRMASHGLINVGLANTIKTKLERALSVIWCQSKDGTAVHVPAENYPYIRYVRHASDWPNEVTTDEQIEDLRDAAKHLRNAINRRR